MIVAAFRTAPALRAWRALRADRRGLALIEFALTLPLIVAVGCWCTELSFLALTNLRISQYALNLADNASRVGVDSGTGVTQLREADINDVLQGARLQGASIGLGANGRVTLTSLENTQQSYDTGYVQRIHWQRCFGMATGTGYATAYGPASTTDGSDNSQSTAGVAAPAGVGDVTPKIQAPRDTGVMVVEVSYNYKPLFGSLFVSPRLIRYVASMMVRDNRDFRQIYNPTPAAVASTCDKFAA